MTNKRACANREGLPALIEHISDMQVIATRLNSLIEIASDVDNEGRNRDGITTLLDVMRGMSTELNNGLDSTNLPEVKA